MNLIVVVTNSKGELVFVSSATEKLLGYTREELIEKGWWKKTFLLEEESKKVKEKTKDTIKGILPLNEHPYDRHVICKDGTVKCIEWRDSLGENNNYISVGVDVTEWKKEEAQNLQHQSILKNIKSIVLVNNNKGEVIYVSPSVINILGYSDYELIGENWWNKTYKDSYDAERNRDAVLKKLYKGEKPLININRRKVKTKSGKYKWIEWRRSRSINNTFISIGTDVTSKIRAENELKMAKENAEESLKAKNEFLANMSHEIRTPLNGIIGFTHLLLETDINENQKKFLNTMQNSGEILLSIINDVLDLSKLESKKLYVEEIHFNLHSKIKEIADIMKVKSDAKEIDLILDIDKNTPEVVLGDPTKIGQILLNLVGNAIKFTNKGSVTIKAYLKNDKSNIPNLSIEVIDTGIGIVSNKINTVFGAFNQAKTDTSRLYGGTGLGLTIVKKMVNLLNGYIEVSSVFGKGSIFKITLPVKIKQGIKSVEEKSIDVITFDPLNLNILLVEDNITNQLLAKTRLEKWNCKVDIAKNGLEGVKSTQKKIYDIILMDVQMPVMDGYEATKIIKNDISKEVSKIPIVGMSAYTSSREVNKMKEVGMETCVFKPFKPNDLYKALQKFGVKK